MTGLEPGDEVYGCRVGSFAPYARAKAGRVAAKPDNLTFEQAAAVPVSGVTALHALHAKARLRPGQKVLVIGASGGVGTFAVQLATAHEAEVTAVCGADAEDLVRSLGAIDVIDYSREEITDRPQRHDVIVDVAGHRALSLVRRALTPKGTFVHVGGDGGSQWSAGAGRQLAMALLSPFLSQNLRGLLAIARQADLLTLKDLIEKGAITPVVDSTYPLSEAPAAIRHLESGHPRGKIVLTVP
ncbi:NAD(P)-dependent alcohol dehydrogenase [Streptomyces sp. PmtG]